jgi:hypothetical protein
LTIGVATDRTMPGIGRLSDSDSRSTITPLAVCVYCQYEFNRHKNPRSCDPVSAIRVASLSLVASLAECRANVTSCSVS